MNTQTERITTCTPCNHFHRCKVHWGSECRKQGGKRIPRMKSYPQEFHAELSEIQVEAKQEKRNRIREELDTVRTRVVGWN
jgi:hypothetical protein